MILTNQQLIIFPYFLISSQIHNILVQYLPLFKAVGNLKNGQTRHFLPKLIKDI